MTFSILSSILNQALAQCIKQQDSGPVHLALTAKLKNAWTLTSYFQVHYGVVVKHWSFLGAFAKFSKSDVSLVMSVRLSAWKNSAPTGRIFMKFHI